jgi:hypothetical protein
MAVTLNNKNYDTVKIQNLSDEASMTIKDIKSEQPQFVRIKYTGAGTCDLGSDKVKAELWFKLRKR